ncbi:MAG: polyprenyl synthetase family protein [Treponema sp.]|nr:polyprenyl synthetase family protein [Treponema sp.]
MDQEYTQRLNKIEAELERWLPASLSGNEQALAEQIFQGIGKKAGAESIRFLLEPPKELLYRGGKRWRPLLMTLVCEALGGGDAAVPLSPLVEFSHNASLIHDDIEDESDERRGKPAVHKLYGTDTAINSGSFFYFLSSCCIENYAAGGAINDHQNKERIYKFWLDCMKNLHLGQAMDINWHRNISIIPNIDEYFIMCRMKTGSLARLAATLGAFIAGASPEIVQKLSDAAEMMGVGFQILDDVKNLTTGIPGKKRGDDIVEGKKSLPVLLYMQKYPEKREMIYNCFNAARNKGVVAPEVEEIIQALDKSGILKEAEERGHLILKETQEIFSSLEFNEKKHILLVNFINLIS